ncbi:MAG: methyl-accepting chemotaxis protein [Pseudomonadota bacterium]
MRIKALLGLSTGITVAIILLLATLSYREIYHNLVPTLEAGENDAQVINVAGRQRMLTQKMTKEALLVAGGNDESAAALRATRDEYTKNLNDLSAGNRALGLSAPPSDEITADFQAIRELWKPFSAAVSTVLEGSPEVPAALDYINRNNIDLLKASNKAVQSWTAYSKGRTEKMVEKSESSFSLTLVVSFLAILAASTISAVLLLRIIRPLHAVRSLVGQYADGDLSRELSVDRHDELGETITAVNEMGAQLRDIVANLSGRSNELQDAFTEVVGSANRLDTNSAELFSEVSTASESFSHFNSSIDSITESASEASESVENITNAMGQMSSTVSEIARNASREQQITSTAQRDVAASRQAMDELSGSMERVGAVVGTISQIAEKTKLLALNATIEAARAGRSGSGFSVVANEVKELARQTSDATKKIADTVASVQTAVSSTESALGNVSGTIAEVSEISATVAVAVEEQSNAIADIADSMNSANERIREVTCSINDSQAEVQRISSTLRAASSIATQSASDASKANIGAEAVSTVSSQLSEIVARFKVGRADTAHTASISGAAATAERLPNDGLPA